MRFYLARIRTKAGANIVRRWSEDKPRSTAPDTPDRRNRQVGHRVGEFLTNAGEEVHAIDTVE